MYKNNFSLVAVATCNHRGAASFSQRQKWWTLLKEGFIYLLCICVYVFESVWMTHGLSYDIHEISWSCWDAWIHRQTDRRTHTYTHTYTNAHTHTDKNTGILKYWIQWIFIELNRRVRRTWVTAWSLNNLISVYKIQRCLFVYKCVSVCVSQMNCRRSVVISTTRRNDNCYRCPVTWHR